MNIKICKKCLTPNTRPRIVFDENGICNACINSENKEKINWEDRKKQFEELIKEIKNLNKNNKYDCIVPWSGGKDSTSIALKLKFEYRLEPLLVTFSPLVKNEIGEYNRQILIEKGFDTIFFSPDGRVAKSLARRFFIERGMKH